MERFCSDIYEIEELFDIKEVGVTSPVECRLDNGNNVIVKYPMNPAGNQVLFNEILGFLIADLIGVNIPKYGICNMSETVIKNTNQNEEIDIRNKGKCFYSLKIGTTVPPNRHGIIQSKYCDVEKVILLDYILYNFDRHIGNILYDINTELVYVIDFSHIISTNLSCDIQEVEALSREENIVKADLYLNNLDVYNILSSFSYSAERMKNDAKEIKQILNKQTIAQVFNTIPPEWKSYVGEEKVEMIKNMICQRVNFIDKIADVVNSERGR